jgi:hypothetical protein
MEDIAMTICQSKARDKWLCALIMQFGYKDHRKAMDQNSLWNADVWKAWEDLEESYA